jgi:hypothetical protein
LPPPMSSSSTMLSPNRPDCLHPLPGIAGAVFTDQCFRAHVIIGGFGQPSMRRSSRPRAPDAFALARGISSPILRLVPLVKIQLRTDPCGPRCHRSVPVAAPYGRRESVMANPHTVGLIVCGHARRLKIQANSSSCVTRTGGRLSKLRIIPEAFPDERTTRPA